MIRVVVFDFDGTLVDSNGVKEACMYKTVAGLEGGTDLLADVRQLGGNRFAVFGEFARRYYGSFGSKDVSAQSRALAERYGRCCFQGIAAAAERKGARQALSTLRRRRVKLWVLSATPVVALRELLLRRGLSKWFRGTLGSPVSKVEGLKLIMRAERVSNRELLMVGDGFDDEGAARAMNVHFAGITLERKLSVRGRFALPDLGRLPALVEEFGRRRAPGR